MELWIRSQDKMNLVKIRQISLNYSNKKQIIANYTPELYENSGGYYELLGTYETKERALEVLDEIQAYLMSDTPQTNVYTMPKNRRKYERVKSRNVCKNYKR